MSTTWLVAYDFSQLAHAALHTAAEMLSRQGGGRLLVVHVHQLGTAADGMGIDLATLSSGGLEQAYIEDAKRQLAEDIAQVNAPNVTIEGRVLSGRAARVIVDVAAEEHVSLIVVGSHGRRGLDRFFIGSVAEAILRQAGCALLVIKQPRGAPAS